MIPFIGISIGLKMGVKSVLLNFHFIDNLFPVLFKQALSYAMFMIQKFNSLDTVLFKLEIFSVLFEND
jgi:hypothetical protein